MSSDFPCFDLRSEAETRVLAAALAPLLEPGDTVLLNGPIGAGKTLFARAVIQARQAPAGLVEEVPSPTFTLVQTYWDGVAEIWHADLYRIHGPDDCAELGLDEAFETAICLVEWPDRLGPLAPPDALTLTFEPDAADAARRICATSGDPGWIDRLAGLPSRAEVPDAG